MLSYCKRLAEKVSSDCTEPLLSNDTQVRSTAHATTLLSNAVKHFSIL